MITPVAPIGTAGGAVSSAIAIAKSTDSAGADFGSVLASLASDARQNLKTGETAAISGLMGKLPLQQVVGAVMAAEQSLTVAIAVRDKVIGAYAEISRMSI
jgi:flagellar hook-basal body complex protein FliE